MQILKDSTTYIVGEVFTKAIPFLLLPYLTRKLGPTGYGELASFQAYVAVAFIIVCLSQDGAIARYFYRYGRRSMGLIIVCGRIVSFTLFTVLACYALYIKSVILFFMLFTALTQTLYSVQLALRQFQKRAMEYSVLQFSNGILTAFFTLLFFECIAAKFEYYILSIVFANLFVFGLGSFRLKQSRPLRMSYSIKSIKKGIQYLLIFGFPLVLHQLSIFSKGQLDRILVIDYFGVEELGVYSAGFQIASIFSVLLMAVNKSTVPYYFDSLRRKTIDQLTIQKWIKYSLLLFFLPSLVSYLLPDVLYELILGEGFSGSRYYTSLFLLGLGLNVPYLLMVNYLFFYGMSRQIAFASISSAVVHVFLLYVIIRFFGLKQLPIALIMSNLLLLFVLHYEFKKINHSAEKDLAGHDIA